MSKLVALFRVHPLTTGLALSMLTITGGSAGTAGYWVYLQPDPQIVVAEPPVVNKGVDAGGVNFAQHLAQGRSPHDWTPVPAKQFRAGETLWVLRHDCFLYKTSGPITRTFLGGNPTDATPNGIIRQLDMIYPPTRTEGCKRANFATVIPADLPPGTYRYQVAVLFYKNPVQPEIRAAFPDVVLDVVK